jgi:hypothetical protein
MTIFLRSLLLFLLWLLTAVAAVWAAFNLWTRPEAFLFEGLYVLASFALYFSYRLIVHVDYTLAIRNPSRLEYYVFKYPDILSNPRVELFRLLSDPNLPEHERRPLEELNELINNIRLGA